VAKDPALLFYTSDFLTGTMLMTHEQVGIYIRMICLMHQSGGDIDRPAFDAFVGIDNKIVRKKFRFKSGRVYHERLLEEMSKRSHKSTSLSKNAKKRWSNTCKSNAIASDLHMPIEDENANENEDEKQYVVKDLKKGDGFKAKKGKKPVTYVKDNPPSFEEVRAYCTERKNNIDPQYFIDKNTTIGWVDKNGLQYRDWKAVIRTWETWTKNTTLSTPPTSSKRPIAIVIVEKIAAGKSDREILHELVGTYSEHQINEALMQARGKVQ
jgi:hypothetical protein